MTQTLLTPTIIAKEALMHLENNLVMGNLVHRQYKKVFIKVGETVTVRKPVKFIANDGADITSQIQDVVEPSTTFTIDKRKNVAWKFSSQELTTTIEQYSERYIQPAMIVLANKVDVALCELYKDIFWKAGTPGITPASFAALGDAAKYLDHAACPPNDRRLVINPDANWAMADAFKGLLEQSMVRRFTQRGQLGHLAGFDIAMDQNIVSHVTGNLTGTPLIDGAQGATSTSTLNINGWTSTTTTIKKGDIITIDGVYAVNPVSKAALSFLQPFVVTADTDTSGSDGVTATLPISPALNALTTDPHQTVSAVAANDAVVHVNKTNPVCNLAFHKDAFGLVTLPLELPDSVAWGARETHRGLSVRIIKGFDILLDYEICRLDIFFGVKTLYPELAVRLHG